ncbi:MAG: hypothetical protein Q9163_005695 [Psora crenata]
MIFTAGDFNISGKFRALSAALTAAFALFALKRLLLGSAPLQYPPPVIPRATFGNGFSRRPSFNTYYHQYESPQDMVIPRHYGREVATESLIGKVTILFNEKDPTYIRALQTHEAHNQRFGYPMFVLRHPILENIWSKPAYLLAALLEEMRKPEGNRLEWLFWVDADTVLMNPKIPLDIFLPPFEYPHIHLLCTQDPRYINNGVFFLRVHPWSIKFISAIIASPVLRPEVKLEYRDQTAFGELLKEKEFGGNYILVPQRWFNAYQRELDDDQQRGFQINRGDLLVHFPGVPHRDKRMRSFIDRAERHLPEWELEVGNTTLPREITEFWAQEHEKLARTRDEAVKLAEEAEVLVKRTEGWLERFSGLMVEGASRDRILLAVDALKRVLYEREDDVGALTNAIGNLRQASGEILQPFMEAAGKDLTKRVYAAVVAGRDTLATVDETKHTELIEEVKAKIAAMNELVVKAPEDIDNIERKLAELQNAAGREEVGKVEEKVE